MKEVLRFVVVWVAVVGNSVRKVVVAVSFLLLLLFSVLIG